MGGCRCTFRKCENSTASRPGMHFFHFPIRDWERLERWAAFADKEEFKELPVSKLKNKVVCEEHFRNHMFMNYLREGLVKTAVPTLEVLENGQIWDLETDEVGEREEWDVPGGKSAEISTGGDPLLVPIENDSSRMEIQFLDSAEIIGDDVAYEVQPDPMSSQPLILNKVHKVKPVVPVATVEKPLLRKVVMKRKKAPASDMPRAKMQILSIQRVTGGKQSDLPATPSQMQLSEPLTLEEVPSATMPSSSTDVAETEKNTPPVVVIQQQPPPEPTKVPIIDPNILEKLDQNSVKIDEVKKLLQDVLDRPVPEPKVITVPVPTPVAAAPPPPPATPTRTRSPSPKPERSGPHMNKVQLFNGIKRYLNPTMVALLRCEMFGGSSERAWKPDERALAVELLNLGENVYDHFCDEFRFRLPSKKDACKWKEQNELDDDDAS
ncbi:titin [Culex pipiens pallens]|uniref:titin n=1 Tax=Culex pipiens pallens TaxID=42434 RepID=UPI0019541719|nr:titin [Culex pipiens pallens]